MSVQVNYVLFFIKSSTFQYIECVGSRVTVPPPPFPPLWFQYIECVGSSFVAINLTVVGCNVSIHRMCRFKSGYGTLGITPFTFQYIECVGSS